MAGTVAGSRPAKQRRRGWRAPVAGDDRGASPIFLSPDAAHRLGAIGLAAVATVWLAAAASTGELDAPTVSGYVVSLGIIGAALALLLARGVRSERSLLIWPLAGNLLLLAVSWQDPRAASLCLSTLTISYVAIGVTQPRWTSAAVVPLSVVVAWFALDLPPDQALVRIFIACCVWITVAELPAWLLTQLREARASMSHMAATDPLTGLPNRRAWDADYAALSARAASAGEPVAVMLVDLDHFKTYNDSQGHLAGDDLLVRFARRLRDEVRTGDLVARWGGEEFAIALSDCDLRRATAVAERIRAGVPGEVTCSVGLTAEIRGETAAATLARADTALYRAKRDGRHRVCVS